MSPRSPYLTYAFLASCLAVALAGCENSSVGTLDVTLSGAALTGTQNVVLAIKGYEAGGVGGQTQVEFSSEVDVDLDAGRIALPTALVPEGYYAWIRLEIDPANSYVTASNGDRYPLDAPATLQPEHRFLVGRGQTVHMLVAIDLRQALSVTTQNGMPQYTLQPLSRLVNLAEVGDITGTIAYSLMIGGLSVTDPACVPEVYVYPGSGIVPQGFFVPVTGGTEPFSSANPTAHDALGYYSFDATLLTPDTYTAAVTCAAADTPGSTSLAFSPVQTTTVTLTKHGTANF